MSNYGNLIKQYKYRVQACKDLRKMSGNTKMGLTILSAKERLFSDFIKDLTDIANNSLNPQILKENINANCN